MHVMNVAFGRIGSRGDAVHERSELVSMRGLALKAWRISCWKVCHSFGKNACKFILEEER